MAAKISDETKLDWLRLIRSDHVGPRGIMAQTPQAGMWCVCSHFVL
jgi:hypothetical protein